MAAGRQIPGLLALGLLAGGGVWFLLGSPAPEPATPTTVATTGATAAATQAPAAPPTAMLDLIGIDPAIARVLAAAESAEVVDERELLESLPPVILRVLVENQAVLNVRVPSEEGPDAP